MDACVVVDGEETEQPRAFCVLGRDPKVVRASSPDLIRHPPGTAGSQAQRSRVQVSSSGVSSERRVESSVERIAKEMREIKARVCRIAVVAAPVVIHARGTEALSAMVRGGYVSACCSAATPTPCTTSSAASSAARRAWT